MRSTHSVSQGFVSDCLGGSLPYFQLVVLLFGTFVLSYTRRVLLCEGLSSQNFYGWWALFESLSDDRAYRDTNLKFSFVVPQVSIIFYFGILNDCFDRPHKRCQGYGLYVRQVFVLVQHQFYVLWQHRDNELDRSCQADPCLSIHIAQRC